MSVRNQVIWRDGLFIKPHHFQQQHRHSEFLARYRSESLSIFLYGLRDVAINQENLVHGRFTVVSANGIFPDGSIFNIPDETRPPESLDLGDVNAVNEIVYLALPLHADGIPEMSESGMAPSQGARYATHKQEVRDIASHEQEAYFVDVAQLKLRLMLESEDRSSYSCVPIARVQEKRGDGSLIIDPSYLPTSYSLEALPELARTLDDFSGLLQQRAKQIASRLGSPGQGGVAEVADFLLLQTINRLGSQFKHLTTIRRIHPCYLYEIFVQAAGELATFTHEGRLPQLWPAYNHDNLSLCFRPVIDSLRRSLSVMLEPNAIALPLARHKYGVVTSELTDTTLIASCVFVLAVKASVRLEKLTHDFPAQTKVSSIEKIRDLINLHLPGVTLQPMPAAPRQLPYHAGFTYFMLDSNSQGWRDLVGSSGFAFHIAGEFPDLEMQFWAIRQT